MNRFWLTITITILAAIVGLAWLPLRTAYSWQPPGWVKLGFFSASGALVVAIWAIAYRKQLERGRLSLVSLFALLAMEAAWFAAFRYMHPNE